MTKPELKKIVKTIVLITIIYFSILIVLSAIQQPTTKSKLMINQEQSIQEHKNEIMATGPLIFVIILITSFLTIMAYSTIKNNSFKKTLKKVAKSIKGELLQDSILTKPYLRANFKGANIIIEVVKKRYSDATQIHFSLDKYYAPTTITRKTLDPKNTIKEHSVGGTRIIESGITAKDEVREKALTPEACEIIRQTKGTWHIRPGEILYEETGIMNDYEQILKIIKACFAMKKGLEA